MTLRVLYNYILTFIGLRKVIPGEIIRTKPIQECGENIVCLMPSEGLYSAEQVVYCRHTIATKLANVAKRLAAQGLGLYIYEIYRSPEQQLARAEATRRQLSETVVDEQELEAKIRQSTAGVGGGHQTGAAVDLCLCSINGEPLDMGSQYPIKCPEMATGYRVSSEQQKRRQLLCKYMREEGFVNYPCEWWHFSYGDQLWAAYRYKHHAIYAPTLVEESSLDYICMNKSKLI